MTVIEERISESIDTKKRILNNTELLNIIQDAADSVAEVFSHGGKILLCGNGGSATDALHIAGEFVGKFQRERHSLPAIALNADIASMTAIANDYDYDSVYEREVEGLMTAKDILVGISTSGNSENVYRALQKAKEIGGTTVALLGKDGGKIRDIADFKIIVPSECTARIQESHIMIGHIICELVEREIMDSRIL